MVSLLASVILGIVADRYGSVPLLFWLVGAFSCVLAWCVLHRWRGPRSGFLSLLLALFAVAAAWHHACWRLFPADDLGLCATQVPRAVCVEAVVRSGCQRIPAPERDWLSAIPHGDRTRLEVTIARVRERGTWREASGRARLTVEGHLLDVRVGDRLRIWALLSASTPPRNPGEYRFSDIERARRRLCSLHAPHPDCIQRLQGGAFAGVGTGVAYLRARGSDLFWQHVGHSRSGLAAAILLGAREQVDPSQTEDFFRTGTIHLLAISGLHVGILAYGFWMGVRCTSLSRRTALWIAIGLVHFYAQLTDARPPVVRASILITCLCVARLSGRKNQPMNTLAFAGLLILGWNPSCLFEVGPQLSFLAVATLVCSRGWLLRPYLPEDPLDRLIVLTRPWPMRMARRVRIAIWRLVSASGVVWLASLPLVMYRFHLVTPVALIVNPVISLPMAVALFSGFGVLVTGWICPDLAAACGALCDASLQVVQWCVERSLSFPGGHFWTPPPPLWWVLGFYLGAAFLVVVPRFRPSPRVCFVGMLVWLILGLGISRGVRSWRRMLRTERLVCTFIALGHGTSVLLELPDGRTLLYDAGQRGSSLSATRSISAVLWSRGMVHLDAIVVSHADSDHFNGIPGLLERFSVDAIYVSPHMFRERAPPLDGLRQAIVDAGVPIRQLSAGDSLWGDGPVSIRVLHPSARDNRDGDNANSIVLCLRWHDRTILLPGDLEQSGLETLMALDPVDCDVLMVPHHGSARSNPAGFALWTQPEWAVISGDAKYDSLEVRGAFRAVGSRTLHTGKRGAIRFEIDAKGLAVRTWRDCPW